MQNPKSENYITWENALFIAEKILYETKYNRARAYKAAANYPDIVFGAINYILNFELED